MEVNDVVLAKAENAAQVFSELESPGESGLRPVRVHGLALADSDDVLLGPGTRDVRGDDVDLMAVASRLAREEVNVLADAAEVWIVVLGNEGDTKRPCVLNVCHRE